MSELTGFLLNTLIDKTVNQLKCYTQRFKTIYRLSKIKKTGVQYTPVNTIICPSGSA